jgi:hypothetical protein
VAALFASLGAILVLRARAVPAVGADTVTAKHFVLAENGRTWGDWSVPRDGGLPAATFEMSDSRGVTNLSLSGRGDVISGNRRNGMTTLLGPQVLVSDSLNVRFSLEIGPDQAVYLLSHPAGGPVEVARLAGALPHTVVFDSIHKVYPHAAAR